jgi:trimethylamine--corrinoid protein Co-methyltransferase
VLTGAEIEALHGAALRVLEGTGVLVHDDEAVALLRAAGMRSDGRRVFIGESAVERALADTPPAFTLAARTPHREVSFGVGSTVCGSASGPAYVLESGQVRPGTLEDLRDSVKLGHQSDPIEYNGDSVEALDVPEERRTRCGVLARLTLSDKACEWVAACEDDLDVAAAANEILFGARWHETPRALIILNTNSPLQLTAETARIIMRWARLRQPMCVTSCVMGGTTGPATLAGVLVVQHAEVLAALVLAQLARPGCPFIYGGVSTMSSLRDGAPHFGTAEAMRLTEATAQMARSCRLPVRTGGAVTDAHSVDAQAAMESAAGLCAAMHSGADFLFQAAGILGSFNVFSREKFVMDVETLRLLDSSRAPIGVEAEDLAVDVIEAAGPAGDYLRQSHTRRHARDFDEPAFFVRETYERWVAAGERDSRSKAAMQAEQMLAAHVAPDDLDAVVLRQLHAYCGQCP